LKSGSLLIGRNSRCDVVLDHFAVSREHARITVVDGAAYFEDLDSRNGVLLNGRAVPPGPAGRQRLYTGDRIRIATFEFVYEEDPSSAVDVSEQEESAEIVSTVHMGDDASRVDAPREKRDKLRSILAIVGGLASATHPERMLPQMLDSLFAGFPQAAAGAIFLRDESTGELRAAAVRRRDSGEAPIPANRALLRQVAEQKSALLTSESGPQGEAGMVGGVQWPVERSLMIAPLIHIDRVLGLVQLGVAPGESGFGQGDLEVLAGVAGHLAHLIHNSRLHDAALRAQRTELELRFRGLVEGSIQGILVHRQLQPLFANEAYARLHGATVPQILELPTIAPLLAPEDRERNMATAGAPSGQFELPVRYETRAFRRDGTEIWLEKFVSIVDWTDGPAFQTAVIDVSERKAVEAALRAAHADLERCVERRTGELEEANRRLEREIAERQQKEQELRDSEALYQSLVEQFPVCVARKNAQGVITFVNRTLAELFQQTPGDFIGKTDYDLFAREVADKYRADDAAVTATARLMEFSDTLVLPGGETRYVHTLKTPIRDAAQQVVGIQLAFWDITAQKQAELERNRYAHELERSNRDLEQFAYSVSHDLQAPLRTIVNYCQLLQRAAAERLDAQEQDFLDSAISGARRMKRLLDDLLAYSRVSTQAEPFQPVDANTVLEEALHNLQAQIVDNGAIVTHDRLPTVVGDATQLMMLFQNLLCNAILYRRGEAPRIHVGVQDRDDDCLFHVRDNGEGIAPEDCERVFQVFRRLQGDKAVPGSGVGLAICKRIAERHGGTIWVESVPGHGSVFYFTLAKPGRGQAPESAPVGARQ